MGLPKGGSLIAEIADFSRGFLLFNNRRWYLIKAGFLMST